MKFANSVAWITGAGRGIGRSIALRLAKEGMTVGLTSRTTKELESVRADVERSGGRAIVAPADLRDVDSVSRAFEQVAAHSRRIDILVNNAGIGVFAPVSTLSVEDFDRMWELNVRGAFLCTRLVLPLMEKAGSGTIVNMSSLAGKNAFVNGAGYVATKWALNGFSNCLRLEIRSSNIRVITIGPGSVATDFSSSASDPARAKRILQPEDVAEALFAAVSLPERAMMSEIDLRPTNP